MKQYYNYTVHKEGIVISHYNKRPLAIQWYKKNKQGKIVPYPRVRIRKDGKSFWIALHRLIAELFIPNPENLPHINHKDGDRFNNHFSNLEWCTHQQNIEHAMENDLNPKGERHGIAVATEEIVREIRKLREDGLTYPVISEIVGLKRRTVEAIGSGQNWKHVI